MQQINLDIDQPDVVIVVSNNYQRSSIMTDIYQTVGYKKFPVYQTGTENIATEDIHYTERVIDNIIHGVTGLVEENIAITFTLPNIPAFINNVAKGLVSIAQDRFLNDRTLSSLYVKFVYTNQSDLKQEPKIKQIKYFNDELEVAVIQTSI